MADDVTVRFLHGLDQYRVDETAVVSAKQAESWAAQGIVSVQDQPAAVKPKRTATAAPPSRKAVT